MFVCLKYRGLVTAFETSNQAPIFRPRGISTEERKIAVSRLFLWEMVNENQNVSTIRTIRNAQILKFINRHVLFCHIS